MSAMRSVLLNIFALLFSITSAQHSCDRNCNGIVMSCNYDFHVEWYTTLSMACGDCPRNSTDCLKPDCIHADGFTRMVQMVNRQFPGPKIEVCQGDEVVVTVHNDMTMETTTMHWHGMNMVGTPYMDGVPGVTQCPIPPMSSFQYRFRAHEAGTHIWHSHSGVQRSNGVYGALIVRQPPSSNLHDSLYDYDLSDHVILVSDWTDFDGLTSFSYRYHVGIVDNPRSILVNGFGRFTNMENSTEGVPAARFTVSRGKKYRFRVISVAHMGAPVALSIDQHKLLVISSDGEDIIPVEADKLTISNGERFDFVLEASEDGDMFWMRFEGLMICATSKAHQAAVVQYREYSIDEYPDGTPTYETSHRDGQDVNGINMPENNYPISKLASVKRMDPRLAGIPDKQFYLTYDMKQVDYPQFQHFNPSNEKLPSIFAPIIDNIVLSPPSIPLLSQRDEYDSSMFCNRSTIDSKCKTEFCSCPHVIQANLGDLIEMVIVDEGKFIDTSHPIHLHGYHFRVVGLERLGTQTTEDQVRMLDNLGLLKRNLIDAPLKDTIMVPDGGYAILRFIADNPGFWILHCHIDFHVELGMALVMQVGDYGQMLPVPEKFPKCGNYAAPPAL